MIVNRDDVRRRQKLFVATKCVMQFYDSTWHVVRDRVSKFSHQFDRFRIYTPVFIPAIVRGRYVSTRPSADFVLLLFSANSNRAGRERAIEESRVPNASISWFPTSRARKKKYCCYNIIICDNFRPSIQKGYRN